MIYLLGFLLIVCVSADIDIHACVLAQFTGSFYRWDLMNGKTFYKELLASRDNRIGNYPVNITWHHIDGESNRAKIYELAPQLYYGNWSNNYLSSDSPQHPCDVIFFARTSSLLPSLLSGLKDNNLRLPVYPYATNGITAFMDLSVTPHVPLWDNVVVAETLCDKELVGVMEWLHLEGAKTVFLLYEADAGAYIDSLVASIRADSARFGWEIVLDKGFPWKPCTDNVCGIEQRRNLDELFSTYVYKRDVRYTADVFISLRNHVKGYECLDEMTYFHDNMINFKAYVMVGCITKSSKDKQIAENNMHHYLIGSVGWDSSFKGEDYDEKFSSVGFFAATGIISPANFAKDWKARFGEAAGHISAAAPLTPFYYFHRDVIKSEGNVSNIIKNFDTARTPETSFYGLMASDSTGTNAFQKWMAIQITRQNTIKIVNQDGKGVYPAPIWQHRHCYPNCVRCPACQVVERATVLVYILCLLPFLILIAVMIIHHQSQKFNIVPKIMSIGSLMSLTMKNASCALAIIIVFMQYSVGLTDDLAAAISMVILTGFAICFSLVTMKTKLGIMWYSYKLDIKNLSLSENKQEAGSKGLYSMMLIESTSELIIPLLTDLPIAIIQLETIIIRKIYSPTMISSLVLLVFSVGGALKMNAISSLLCQCLEYENIPIIGQFTIPLKLKCAFNPCFGSKQLLRGVLNELLDPDEEYMDMKHMASATCSEIHYALEKIGRLRRASSVLVLPIKADKQKSI